MSFRSIVEFCLNKFFKTRICWVFLNIDEFFHESESNRSTLASDSYFIFFQHSTKTRLKKLLNKSRQLSLPHFMSKLRQLSSHEFSNVVN